MSSAGSLRRPEGFGDFIDLSKRIGSDILKTQGAGGNTSIKQADAMWVKASGTWLAHAAESDIMVPVAVSPLVQALRQADPRAEKATDFVIADLNASGLRPSIETSFHAALLNPVVAHYHCVNTIALAVLERRQELLAERLNKIADLRWATIPYRRPGTPLARDIDLVAGERPDVLVLFNHGIIVCGETAGDVSERIERVTAVLAMDPRETPDPDMEALATLASGSGYRPATDPASHTTALCPIAMEIALGGSLYPDHVIFLGRKLGLLGDGQTLQQLLTEYEQRGETPPKMVIAPGKGVLLSEALTPGGEAMVRCLAEVVTRIPAGEKIVYLSDAQELELTNWEAEQYRQALDRKVAGQAS